MTPSIELFNELRAAMEESPESSRHGNDLVTRLANSSGAVRIFLELDGRMGIFIPLGKDDPRSIPPDIRSRYITLRTVQRDGRDLIQLQLENPALENVFHVFVDTFFKHFRADRERAATIAQAQLKRWRSLFTPVPPNSLSDAEEIGLVDCFSREKACFVEWPEFAAPWLPAAAPRLLIRRSTAPDQRALHFIIPQEEAWLLAAIKP